MIDVIEPELHAAAFAAGRECSTRRGLRNTNSPEGDLDGMLWHCPTECAA